MIKKVIQKAGLIALAALTLASCSVSDKYVKAPSAGKSTLAYAQSLEKPAQEPQSLISTEEGTLASVYTETPAQATPANEKANKSAERKMTRRNHLTKRTSSGTIHSSGIGRAIEKTAAKAKVLTARPLSKASKGAMEGDKSWIVALLLVIFVGALGIHRFYLGYTAIGIIQLLTLGGCGIWALIDLIRIIIRDLQPKDGEYTD